MNNPFTRFSRARDKPQNKVSDAPTFSFGGSLAGKSVSPRSAVQVSAVYACVRVIAETLAAIIFIRRAITASGREVISLGDAAKDFIANWESEKYRKQLAGKK